MPQTTLFNLPSTSSTSQSSSAAQKPSQKTSLLWDYAADVEDGQAPFGLVVGLLEKRVWRCQLCVAKVIITPQEYEIAGGGPHFRKHLLKKYGVTVQTSVQEAQEGHAKETERITSMTGWNDNIRGSSKRERATTVSSITARDLRALFLNWIAADNLLFKTAESPHFRQFLQYVNPHANDLLPVSGKTTRQDLKTSVKLRHPAIVKTLKQARSKIHLVYNGWTSTNHMSLFGIQARFLDTDLQLQTLLLGLPKINQDHSGVDCAQLAIATLERYECSYQLGFTVSDNASNMDTMVQEIERQFEANGHRWDAQFHRFRCLGHIIHLAASDFFFRGGKVFCHPRRRRPPPVAREGRRNQPTAAAEPAADLAVEDDAPTPAPIVNDAAAWRKYGCYGKLHNIVVWVQASTARRERFKALSHLQLIRNNATRWHSYYNMCNRALEVKDQLILFLTNKQDLEDEALTLEDWRHLAEITSFFYPFFNATKTNKGIFNAIDRVPPVSNTS